MDCGYSIGTVKEELNALVLEVKPGLCLLIPGRRRRGLVSLVGGTHHFVRVAEGYRHPSVNRVPVPRRTA